MEATATKATSQKYPAYKESGVEWMGQIPAHWDMLPNKFIFKLKKDLVGKKSNQYTLLSLTLHGIIKRDMENPQGKFPAEFDTYQEVNNGDFVFCLFDVEETPRCVGLSDFDGMITGAYTVMQVGSKFDKRFLYYFYLNLDKDKRLRPLYTGLRNTISKDNFFAFKAFVPPLPEQTAIAAFLDDKTAKIDRAIAQKEKMIALLKERKQIIIQNAVTKGLDPNAKMKHSGVEWIGEIPEGWEVKRLKVIVKSRTGFAFPSDRFVNEGIPLVRIGDLDSSGVVILDSCAKLPYDYSKYLMLYGLKENDLLFAMTGGTIGKIAVYKGCANALLNQRVCSFTINDTITRSIVLFWMSTKYWKDYIDLNSIGGAQPNISDKVVLNIRIALSKNKAEQCFIISHIETQSAKIDKAIQLQEQQIEKLNELKSTLIDSAVTGKIKVS